MIEDGHTSWSRFEHAMLNEFDIKEIAKIIRR